MANSRQIVALNVGSQRVSMGVFSKTNKNALILDRYATRLIVLDPSAEGMRLTKVGEAVADLVQELRVKGGRCQLFRIRTVRLHPLCQTSRPGRHGR